MQKNLDFCKILHADSARLGAFNEEFVNNTPLPDLNLKPWGKDEGRYLEGKVANQGKGHTRMSLPGNNPKMPGSWPTVHRGGSSLRLVWQSPPAVWSM